MTLIVVNQPKNENDTYEIVGRDQPLGTLVKKESVRHIGEQESEVILTIKVPGRKYRYGLMPNDIGYAPAEYQVYRVLWEKRISDFKVHIKTQQLTSFPVRTPKVNNMEA